MLFCAPIFSFLSCLVGVRALVSGLLCSLCQVSLSLILTCFMCYLSFSLLLLLHHRSWVSGKWVDLGCNSEIVGESGFVSTMIHTETALCRNVGSSAHCYLLSWTQFDKWRREMKVIQAKRWITGVCRKQGSIFFCGKNIFVCRSMSTHCSRMVDPSINTSDIVAYILNSAHIELHSLLNTKDAKCSIWGSSHRTGSEISTLKNTCS
jgi:hypothetical protein